MEPYKKFLSKAVHTLRTALLTRLTSSTKGALTLPHRTRQNPSGTCTHNWEGQASQYPAMEWKWPMVAGSQEINAFFLHPEGWPWTCFTWLPKWNPGARQLITHKSEQIHNTASVDCPSGSASPPVPHFPSLGSHCPIRCLPISIGLRLCFLGTQAETGKQDLHT